MPKEITKTYTNGEITVVWKPGECIHSAVCFKGLGEVFDPKARPWVNINGANSEHIVAQIDKCPSGALSYFRNNDIQGQAEKIEAESIVEAVPNGPLLVYGNLSVKDSVGNTVQKTKVTAFCRCGASANKPYCDGTHTKVGFAG